MIARALPASVLLLVALALAGCSAGSGVSSSRSDYDVGQAPEVAVPGAGVADAAADGGAGGDSGGDDSGGVAFSPADRQVVTTGTATLTVDDPADAAADATRIVESAGGRVDARTVTAPTDGDPGGATLTVRIPSDRLTPTMDALEALGEVERVSLSDSDVTQTVQDLDARITAARTSVDRLLALLGAAGSTKDLIAIENALQQRQADLESMQAQQRYYADQVSMATVDISLVAVENAPVDAPSTFLDGLAGGWGAFVAFLAGALVVLGAALPWLAFLAVLAGVVLAVVRGRGRSRARRRPAADAADDSGEEPADAAGDDADDAADEAPGTTIRR
ncbi:DUF4349 domain-containing protein [Galbitalea sp. SE-J8]|uniref:DUF4349 domain-containing protein n=1 Tax=Galbitalea sp. SE-J8 TaxID=3054952 RepID=UPI00259D0528|nr:DUF4349 domain-containing protein [Galbitalea sp. SE-J8]MDM4762087.1 DUF4349 domain-containing protein [Galbitalea sp. SE-J8]